MKKALLIGLGSLVLLAVLAGGAMAFVFIHYGEDLPDHTQLAQYEPAITTRVHAADGRLLAEYAVEQRVFVPLEAMPKRLIDAFLAAEDKTFYEHFGLDLMGVAGAVITNLANLGGDKRPVGASTITQQVAKNFLLTNEVSFSRKIKEAILAMRIEDAFSKDRILELYLNEIYLGGGAYGAAAAALKYFDRSLNELTLGEMAYLAALPKAPNNYHPTKKYEAAVSRRDWVLAQMLENGMITQAEADAAMLEPLLTRSRATEQYVEAPHFAEEVRRELYDRYGENALYKGGLSVRTTVDPRRQAIAEAALRNGLLAYDMRHGWRGPITTIELDVEWPKKMAAIELPPAPKAWRAGVVLAVSPTRAEVGFADSSRGAIPLSELEWARPNRKDQKLGPPVKKASDVLTAGDIVFVEPIVEGGARYRLRQVPDASGGLVAINPHTGRVVAMVGGFDFGSSEFNRATQAHRQPGSAFKPFVYLAALDHGLTPASVVLDAPLVIDQGEHLGKWKPENYTQRFYGPSTLRLGLEKSRNLMTVRVAQQIGMDKISDYARRFGIHPELPPVPSAALGAIETTLVNLTAAYAMLVNGGRKIEPILIERVQDRTGATIFQSDERPCEDCRAAAWQEQSPPELPDEREQVADPRTAYQVVSMLEGVVQRGTGRALSVIGKPIGGKTGTTNDFNDAWFIGFTPDLVVGVYVGFDQPRTLGKKEAGGRVAAPIVREFLTDALRDEPAVPFRVPRGVRFVRIDRGSGMLASAASEEVIVEAFLPGTEPKRTHRAQVTLGEGGDQGFGGTGFESIPTDGVGGLY